MSKAKERLDEFLRTPEYGVIDSDRITSEYNGNAYLPISHLVNLANDMNHKTLEDVKELLAKYKRHGELYIENKEMFYDDLEKLKI